MELNLKLDESALKGALSEAILAQLNEKAREEVIRQAIAFLVTPQTDGRYDSQSRKSPLQTAFETATEAVLRERVLQFCRDSPEIKRVLDEELDKAAKALLVNNHETRSRLQHELGKVLATIALREE